MLPLDLNILSFNINVHLLDSGMVAFTRNMYNNRCNAQLFDWIMSSLEMLLKVTKYSRHDQKDPNGQVIH